MPDVAPGHILDLDAYLARIRYNGTRSPTLATLRALHLHQVLAIPFENLDVLLDRTIALDLSSLERKLVHDRRGDRLPAVRDEQTTRRSSLQSII